MNIVSGPIQYYLAKVDSAATTGTTGLQWFKVAQDGLSNGKWAVDTMIANGGWHYFDMPSCISPGDYLLRAELIALHSAQTQGNTTLKISSRDTVDFTNRRRPILHGVCADSRYW
jgi:hypothetical protein